MRAPWIAAAAMAVVLAAAPAAAAAPPPNDERQSAIELELPSTVQGTTVDATLSPGEENTIQGVPIGGSVWYRVSSVQPQRLVLDLAANGDLDAAIEIYRRARSQLRLEQSLFTDEDGRSILVHDIRGGSTYFIRIARLANSEAGTFSLRAHVPKGPPPGPGPLIKAGAARGTVDPLNATADAWSARLRPGTTYRINLVNRSSRPLGFGMYAPGTRNFESAGTVGSSRGYQLFTPGPDEGGRYSFLVTATGLGAPQRYRLRIVPAGLDDLWPGRNLRNYQRIAGKLNARQIDVVDTYRFDVVNRSAVAVHLRPSGLANLRFTLRRADGTRLGTAGSDGVEAVFERHLGIGRYVVTVSAAPGSKARYRVWRVARTITALRLFRIGGPVRLGQAATLGLRLSPGESGAATVVVERFDPASGWHFDRELRARIVGGSGSVSFRPPTHGRWRARASFAGTRQAQPSETTKDLRFEVLTPLDPR